MRNLGHTQGCWNSSLTRWFGRSTAMLSYRSLSYTCLLTQCKSSSSLHYCRTLIPQKIQVNWYRCSIQVIELVGYIVRVSRMRDMDGWFKWIIIWKVIYLNNAVQIFDLSYIHLLWLLLLSPTSTTGYIKKLTKWPTPSWLDCSVEHCTGIREVTGSNPVQAGIFPDIKLLSVFDILIYVNMASLLAAVKMINLQKSKRNFRYVLVGNWCPAGCGALE